MVSQNASGNEIKMDFSETLMHLKAGGRAQRDGWNGKGMMIFLIPSSTFQVTKGRPMAAIFPVDTYVQYLPHIDMLTADGSVVPWLASQTDILANDWLIV
jgi:hypothetical protein